MNKNVLTFLMVWPLATLAVTVYAAIDEAKTEINPTFAAFWDLDIAGFVSQANDRLGQSLTSGDFNGDGFTDLAIGVPNRDVFGSDVGMVMVLYANQNALTSDDSSILFGTDIQIDQKYAASLTSGDFNNDGFDDLVVGAPNRSYVNPQTSIVAENTGAIYIHYGSSDGLPSSGLFIDANSGDELVNDRQVFAEFGRSLTTGDFDNDGFDDLVVGVPRHNLRDQNNVLRENAGMLFVYYGGQQISGNMGISFMVRDLIHQDTAGIIGGVEENDFFGFSLASGDLDNNGFDDLVVGVPFETISDESVAGIVQIIYGGSGGLIADDEIWSQSDVTGAVTEAGDLFGYSIATGDVNNDGHDDLLVGSPLEDIGDTSDAGAAHFIPGSANGLISVGSLTFSQMTDGIFGGPETLDQLGLSVAVVDLDLDGFSDAIVGVPFEEFNGAASGVVHVIPGVANGLDFADSSFLAGSSAQDNFGFSFSSTEHFFGNSLIVSAPGRDSNTNEVMAGSVYEYFYRSEDIIFKDGFDFTFSK